jgi:hypothetical protein
MPRVDDIAIPVLGISILGYLAVRIARLFAVAGVDAVAVGLLASFAALSIAATVLSIPHLLNGATWVACLAMVTAGTLVIAPPATSANPQIDHARRISGGVRPRHYIILLLPAVFVAWMQFVSPVEKFDDLMYHGSRAGYWLHNHSVLPFPSHNDRQEAFPYPGDLIFAFGVFSGHSEALGRMMVFLAYPALLLLTAGILQKHAVPVSLAIAAAWVVGVTPQVFNAALGIAPDLWGAVFTLIALNATCDSLEATTRGERRKQGTILLGAVTAAIGVKFTYGLLLPLVVVPFLYHRREYPFLVTVGACWLLSFGLPITMAHNRATFHGLLGSSGFTAGHRPDPGIVPIVRNLERLPFVLAGIPWVPSQAVRGAIQGGLQRVADMIGATRPLRWEDASEWPGTFSPAVPKVDVGYSLLWALALGAVIASLASRPRARLDRPAKMALGYIAFGIWFAVGLTCAVRWQAAANVPQRFLLPAATAVVIGAVWYWQHTTGGQRRLLAGAVALGIFHALPFLNEVRHLAAGDLPYRQPQSVLSPAADIVPPGARVLLVISENAGDYVMFHPSLGFPTSAVSWGQRAFSPHDLAAILRDKGVNCVVFEGERVEWPRSNPTIRHAYVSTLPFMNFFEQETSFVRQPGGYPNVIYTSPRASR